MTSKQTLRTQKGSIEIWILLVSLSILGMGLAAHERISMLSKRLSAVHLKNSSASASEVTLFNSLNGALRNESSERLISIIGEDKAVRSYLLQERSHGIPNWSLLESNKSSQNSLLLRDTHFDRARSSNKVIYTTEPISISIDGSLAIESLVISLKKHSLIQLFATEDLYLRAVSDASGKGFLLLLHSSTGLLRYPSNNKLYKCKAFEDGKTALFSTSYKLCSYELSSRYWPKTRVLGHSIKNGLYLDKN